METAEAVLIAGLFGKILLLLFAQMETEKSQEIVKKGGSRRDGGQQAYRSADFINW